MTNDELKKLNRAITWDWAKPSPKPEADDDSEPEGCDECMTYPCSCDEEEELQ